MLQSLLEDRFKLVARKETMPVTTWVLSAGKQPHLKEADGNGPPGCRPPEASGGAPAEGSGRLVMMSPDGKQTVLTLGPGVTIQYTCRNMTMEAFVSNLRSMIGTNVGSNPILEETGLKGAWNFDLKISLSLNGMTIGPNVERISIVEAIDKQLGLKLEERQVPTLVLVVDKVNRKPTDNAPGLAEILPPVTLPTNRSRQRASSRPTRMSPAPRMSRFQTQPGGRLTADNMALRFLVNRAFNTNNNEYIAGLPKFAEADRYDIVAKAPAGSPSQLDMETLGPMLRSLLVDRFKMAYHTEERPVTAYALAASKPKMKKADPASRAFCRNEPPRRERRPDRARSPARTSPWRSLRTACNI